MCVVCVPTLCKYMFNMYVDFHTLYSLPLPLGFVMLSFLHQFLEPLFDIASDSNLGSFICETVYDAASTIDYSKDPIDAGVVGSPPPKKIFRHSPSPSLLKRFDRTCVPTPPSLPVGAGAPQRRLRMDARPTNSGPPRPFARRFARPSQLGRERPSYQGAIHYNPSTL